MASTIFLLISILIMIKIRLRSRKTLSPDFDSKLVFLALLLSGEVLKKTKNVVDTNKIFNTIKIDKNEVNTVSMMSCSYESPKIKLAKLTITLWSLIETKAR